MRKSLILFIFIFAWFPAYAVLDLELTEGANNAVPIAILPFSGSDRVAPVVGQDLQNSGRFKLADISDLVQGQDYNAISYPYWSGRKVNDVVTGKIQVSDGKYQVSFRLFDTYNKSVLLEKQYTVGENQLRQLAHHISDLIYQQITGDRGVFSTKIAYILVDRQANLPAKYRLEVSDVDGYNPHSLLTTDQPLMSPAWSPDGTKLAYVSFEGNRAAIYVQDVATGNRHVLTRYAGINGAPAWSPDGKKMAVVLTETGYPKIYVLDLVNNSVTRVTNDWYLDTEPAWALDGKSIIFTSNRGGTPQIYRVTLSNKKIDRVTYKGNYNARASFTSDGKNIVILHQEGDAFNIALQDLSSGRVMVLTKTGADESPTVAPNGKMVMYATNYRGKGMLAAVSTDGKVQILLPSREGEVQEPAWGPFEKQ